MESAVKLYARLPGIYRKDVPTLLEFMRSIVEVQYALLHFKKVLNPWFKIPDSKKRRLRANLESKLLFKFNLAF